MDNPACASRRNSLSQIPQLLSIGAEGEETERRLKIRMEVKMRTKRKKITHREVEISFGMHRQRMHARVYYTPASSRCNVTSLPSSHPLYFSTSAANAPSIIVQPRFQTNTLWIVNLLRSLRFISWYGVSLKLSFPWVTSRHVRWNSLNFVTLHMLSARAYTLSLNAHHEGIQTEDIGC